MEADEPGRRARLAAGFRAVRPLDHHTELSTTAEVPLPPADALPLIIPLCTQRLTPAVTHLQARALAGACTCVFEMCAPVLLHNCALPSTTCSNVTNHTPTSSRHYNFSSFICFLLQFRRWVRTVGQVRLHPPPPPAALAALPRRKVAPCTAWLTWHWLRRQPTEHKGTAGAQLDHRRSKAGSFQVCLLHLEACTWDRAWPGKSACICPHTRGVSSRGSAPTDPLAIFARLRLAQHAFWRQIGPLPSFQACSVSHSALRAQVNMCADARSISGRGSSPLGPHHSLSRSLSPAPSGRLNGRAPLAADVDARADESLAPMQRCLLQTTQPLAWS